MKKIFYAALSMAAAMTLTTSCSNDDNVETTPQQAVVAYHTVPFTVRVSGEADTRASVNDDGYTLVFSEGDVLYVAEDGVAYGTLTLSEGAGSTTGTFTGNLAFAEGKDALSSPSATLLPSGYASNNFYTVSEAGSDGKRTITYDYSKAGIEATLKDAVEKYSVLESTSYSTESGFKLAAANAFFVVTANGVAGSTVKATVTADDALNLSNESVSASEGSTTFAFPIAAATYSSIAVTVNDGSDHQFTLSSQAVAAKGVYNMERAAATITAKVGSETKTFSSLAEAISGGATEVTLNEDETSTSNFTLTSDLTLNLNDNTLTINPTSGNVGFWVKTANLTINAGDEGKVVFGDGEAYGFYVVPDANDQGTGSLTINGGTYEFGSSVSYGIYSFVNGPVKISDATFTSTKSTSGGSVIYVWNDECTMENVTVTSEGSGCFYAGGGGFYTSESDHTLLKKHCTATIKNCTFTNNSCSGSSYSWMSSALAVSHGAELTVDGGTYTGYTAAAYVFSSGGTINLKSGTYKGTTNCLRADKDNTGKVTIGNQTILYSDFGDSFIYYSSGCTLTGDNKASNSNCHIEPKSF